jgi:NADP-dependent 3-hydroxy acid dehydrogenase YdfG
MLAAEGFDVVIGARRVDRLEVIAREIGARFLPLDVSDADSVVSFAEAIPSASILVNNAGGALGLDRLEAAKDDDWITMFQTNILGLMRTTRAFLPKLEASGDGHIVNLGSIASFETYIGGAGYTAAKHGTRAISETLRLELLGKPIRVTEVDPGLVDTEFSLVRFAGNLNRANQVYAGMTPLSADDVAEAIVWAVTRPSHVNIDNMVIRPRYQATATMVHRRTQ